ncbi:MAG: VanZ family protein [Candidatus Buchananbacteria bacterium]
MKKILVWAIFIFWLWFIWFAASQPGLTSGFSLEVDTFGRKAIHFLIYFTLTYWGYRVLTQHQVKYALFWAFIFALVYAATDEYHQSFVFGRNGSPIDWGIDTLGAVLFIFLQGRNLDFKIF